MLGDSDDSDDSDDLADLTLDLDEPGGCGHCSAAACPDAFAPVTPPGRPWPPGDSTEPLDLDTDGGAWDAPILSPWAYRLLLLTFAAVAVVAALLAFGKT